MDYKITNSDLWYRISREVDWVEQYLDVNGEWNNNKTWAKLFFHRDDAASALALVKHTWRLKMRKTEQKQKVEKQTWGEFSS